MQRFIIFVLTGMFCIAVFAQEQPKTEPETIRIRQWLAPWKDIEKWPWGKEPYLPIKKREFDDWAEHFKSPDALHSVQSASISAIRLSAKLDRNQLIAGTGVFYFRKNNREDENTVLSPLGLAINRLFWKNADSNDSEPASLGMSPSGETTFSVQKDGELTFSWSLRGREVGNQQEIQFDFLLPSSPAIDLTLELPEHLVPSVSNGIVTELHTANAVKTWKIMLGGRNVSTISIWTSKEIVAKSPGVHQSINYDINLNGLDVTSTFLYDQSPQSSEIILELDQPLRILRVLQGQTQLEWSVFHLPEDSQASKYRIIVNLPKNTKADVREIRLHAQCSIVWNAMWSLPRIRSVTSESCWMDAKATVLIGPSLLVSAINANDAVQVFATERPSRETFSFQFFNDSAQIALRLMGHSAAATWKTGSDVRFGTNEATATVTMDCSVLEGSLYQIRIPVNKKWVVDALESIPKNSAQFWNTEEGDQQTISVYLKTPIQSETPLRLKILAHSTEPNNLTAIGDLLPVPIESQISQQHVLAIQSGTNTLRFGKTIKKDDVVPLVTLDAQARQRFAEMPSSAATFIQLSDSYLSVPFHLESLKERFVGEISGKITLESGFFTQSYRFRCVPTKTRIDRVLVLFSNDSTKSCLWNWNLGNENDKPNNVRLVSQSERAELELGDKGDLWEISLDTARSGPFDLYALRTVSYEGNTPKGVPLATLPEASLQSANIIVDSPNVQPVSVVVNGLKTLSPTPPEENSFQTQKKIVQYDPQRDVLGAINDSSIYIVHDVSISTPSAWVWSLEFSSLYDPNGKVRQRALYYIENRGRDKITVALPLGVKTENIHAVWVDNKREIWQKGFAQIYREAELAEASSQSVEFGELLQNRRSVTISLPHAKRFMTVLIEFTMEEAPLPFRKTLYPNFPDIDIPVFSGHWRVWVPFAYDLLLPDSSESITLLEKALSRLVFRRDDPVLSISGSSKITPFNPFLVSEWQSQLFPKSLDRQKSLTIARQFLTALGNEKLLESIAESEVSAIEAEYDAKNVSNEEPEELHSLTLRSSLNYGILFNNTLFLTAASDVFDVSILVDYSALNRSGVVPSTFVPITRSEDAITNGQAKLERAGLCLVFLDERRILLTSALIAAQHRDEMDPLEGDRTWLLKSGSFSDWVHTEFALSSDKETFGAFLPLSEWTKSTPMAVRPWNWPNQAPRLSSLAPGWTASEISIALANRGIYIQHRNTLEALRWLTLLFVFVVTLRQPLANPRVLCFLLLFFGAACVFLPTSYYRIADGAFLGTLFSLGFSLIGFFSKNVAVLPAEGRIIRKCSADTETP